MWPIIKCIVENIHVSSLALKSLIGINTTKDSPGCEPVYTISIKQFHNGILGFKSQVQLQKSETVLSSSQNKCFRCWYLIGDNPILCSMNFVSILPIWIKESVDTIFFGRIILEFTLGVIVTMIPVDYGPHCLPCIAYMIHLSHLKHRIEFPIKRRNFREFLCIVYKICKYKASMNIFLGASVFRQEIWKKIKLDFLKNCN